MRKKEHNLVHGKYIRKTTKGKAKNLKLKD